DEYCAIKQSIAMALEQYPLAHTTIEIELPEEACRDQPVPSQTDQH
ncbi:MAG: cation transporter, partial [Oleibacter sp.]|nr:cation transporter [Thalassolituus sp.]